MLNKEYAAVCNNVIEVYSTEEYIVDRIGKDLWEELKEIGYGALDDTIVYENNTIYNLLWPYDIHSRLIEKGYLLYIDNMFGDIDLLFKNNIKGYEIVINNKSRVVSINRIEE